MAVAAVKNHLLFQDNRKVPVMASPNTGGALRPRFIVIHYTAGGLSFDTARYFARSDLANPVSAHLVVKRDGTIIQCVPFNVVAWHAGKSSWVGKDGKTYEAFNSHSIGIEIENWGPLVRTAAGTWIPRGGASETVDASKVIEACHSFGAPSCGWETFTSAQMNATAEACRALCSEYGIKEIVGHDNISPGRKSDPGPAFNMTSFRAAIFGRREDESSVFVVRSPNGLNIRSGPGSQFPTVRDTPIPNNTSVLVHQVDGLWCFVSVLDKNRKPEFSGWVHDNFLYED